MESQLITENFSDIYETVSSFPSTREGKSDMLARLEGKKKLWTLMIGRGCAQSSVELLPRVGNTGVPPLPFARRPEDGLLGPAFLIMCVIIH